MSFGCISTRHRFATIKDMSASKFGEFIKEQRLKKRLTRQDFSSLINISAGYLNHLERGSRIPSHEVIANIAEKLGVSSGYLFELLEGTNSEGETEKELLYWLRADPILDPRTKRNIEQIIQAEYEEAKRELPERPIDPGIRWPEGIPDMSGKNKKDKKGA